MTEKQKRERERLRWVHMSQDRKGVKYTYIYNSDAKRIFCNSIGH